MIYRLSCALTFLHDDANLWPLWDWIEEECFWGGGKEGERYIVDILSVNCPHFTRKLSTFYPDSIVAIHGRFLISIAPRIGSIKEKTIVDDEIVHDIVIPSFFLWSNTRPPSCILCTTSLLEYIWI